MGQAVANLERILLTLRERLPGAQVLAATVYDPTDGTGTMDGLLSGETVVAWLGRYNQQVRALCGRGLATLVDAHRHFLGCEVRGHRALVVRDQEPTIPGGERQHLEIVEPHQPSLGRGAEVGLGKASQHGRNDDLVQVRVRLEADAHQRTSGVCLFASASFW